MNDKQLTIKTLKDQGVKIIPVKMHSKKPDVPDFEKYLTGEKLYDDEITTEQNYGVICGKTSDNLTVFDIEKIDPDDYWSKNPKPKHIPLEDGFIDGIIPNCLNETFTTKTGSQNVHILVKLEKIPPKTSKLIYIKDEKNIYQIDFKVTGQCVEAGSIHENGNPYEIISNTTTIKRLDLQLVLENLNKIGFRSPNEWNNEIQNDFNTWTIEELMHEPWIRGERRRKQKSLYCKLRRMKKSPREIKKIISQINDTQDEPLDKDELDYNFKDAEKYFQNVVLPTWGYQEDVINPVHTKDEIQKFITYFIRRYDIVTPHNTNDIYYRDGVIHKLGIDGILKDELRRIIISNQHYNDLKFNIGIQSQIPMGEPNPFDNDLIGLSNVVLDPNTFEPITTTAYVNSFLPRRYRPELRNLEDKILTAIKQILDDQYDKFLAICVILLTGKNNVKKMPIFDGAPDSGKTTLLEILQTFVGIFTSIHIRKLQEETRLLAKCTCRLNVTDEAENCISDPDRFKQTIDGTVQQEAWKYEKEFATYDPNKVLHVGGANGIPDIMGEAGIAKRIVRIPCRNHFEKNDVWKKALLTEDNLDRFLITAIDYAKSGAKNPLLDMNTNEKAILYEILGDPVRHFKENYMYQNDGEYCMPPDVYDAFDKFRKENGINKEFSPAKFARELDIKSMSKRVNGKPVKVYLGWNLAGKSSVDQTL
ncbi:bifunctional DNA primase/polymerase [Candidatus Nitrosotenuis aquarius]|uniref:bifunctional DNA primase/polymerase n=1 Tax=Candidatus Nitrosotenuis aquarius TaxID=1846278 RepID=UPI000C1E90FE|nr:bifunctional DNA primase/polymerase [Candidatus Nitrosotenuis aquarius]